MSVRAVHFVGSFPAASTDDAMRAMLAAGPRLRTLPTGEVRRYEWYIQPIIDDLVAQGVLEVSKLGSWRSSKDRPIHRVPRGVELAGGMLNFGYLEEAREALPIFTRLRAVADLPGLSLQVGMPTDFTMTFIATGVTGLRRHRKAFQEATIREITAIRELAGDDVVVQLEATGEMVLMAKTQPVHRRIDAAVGLARGIAETAAATPAGTRIGVHLCLGSMRNKARTTLRDTRPLVDLANSIARQWPSGRTLEYIHGPLAAGDIPPVPNYEFYEPLSGLELGRGTRFYAGLVHETPTEAAQVETIRMVEKALGRPLDGVASACGLGRRPRLIADALVARAATLAVSD
ncbi:hypothetical protein OHB26_19800 [Nocardia sp. NBC_01503]|uniref:hypothetical protein n=1 Tax=Nocardia sp. NBC_01503 TaxID=2975997 RepID=UPI002E7B8244|nr:hypothetical protein [Nocardia sp. NBC_01503]WTL29261.1 hypothetical protein OHB26_19800 [Nocardia sp. NBC_01503]